MVQGWTDFFIKKTYLRVKKMCQKEPFCNKNVRSMQICYFRGRHILSYRFSLLKLVSISSSKLMESNNHCLNKKKKGFSTNNYPQNIYLCVNKFIAQNYLSMQLFVCVYIQIYNHSPIIIIITTIIISTYKYTSVVKNAVELVQKGFGTI